MAVRPQSPAMTLCICFATFLQDPQDDLQVAIRHHRTPKWHVNMSLDTV